jgi:hypothetical protein
MYRCTAIVISETTSNEVFSLPRGIFRRPCIRNRRNRKSEMTTFSVFGTFLAGSRDFSRFLSRPIILKKYIYLKRACRSETAFEKFAKMYLGASASGWNA